MRGLIFAVLAGALFVAAPSTADQIVKTKYNTLIVPTHSPVRLAAVSRELSYARFDGSFILAGIYHITRTAAVSGTHDYTEVYFEPDGKFVAQLPYWKPYKQHASQITFDNTDDFVKAVLTKDAKAKLQQKNRSAVSGRVTIKVTGFWTSVECDWPHFGVHFQSIEHAPVLLVNAKDDDTGC